MLLTIIPTLTWESTYSLIAYYIESLLHKGPIDSMFRHYLVCLLALLLALQSVNTVAYVHQLHQAGAEHMEFDHSYQPTDVESDNQLTQYTAEKPNQSLYDCHNSGHCHGHTVAALAATIPGLVVLNSKETLSSYLANLTSVIPPSLFRPPIA